MIYFLTEPKYSLSLEGKLRDGEIVAQENIRFLASLVHNGTFLCGAFMVSEKHALTVAHCLNDFFLLWPIPNFNEYCLMLHGGLGNFPDKNYPIEQLETLYRYNPSKPSPSSNLAVITVDRLCTFM